MSIYIVKGLKQSGIKLVEPKDITLSISFTYLIWKKESGTIILTVEKTDHQYKMMHTAA